MPVSLIRHFMRDLCFGNDKEVCTAIECPVFLAQGALDAMDPVERAKDVAAMIRQSELHIYEKSGHFPLYTSPEEFYTLLERFLKRRVSATNPPAT